MQKANRFKKNDVVRVEIQDLTDLGFGVGRVEGIVIFVPDTVIGDVIEAKIIKVNASYLVGRAEKYIEKSKMRTEGRCNESACRSCAYKNISYSDELKLKEEGVRRIFSTEGLSHIKTMPIIASPCETRYRNKAQYPIGITAGGEYTVGFYAPKSHRVTPVGDCPLTPRVFSELCDELRGIFAEQKYTVYDEVSGVGLLRHVYIRRGEVTGEVLLTLVICGDSLHHSDELVSQLTERFPSLVGILLNINKDNTNVVLGDKFVTLWGRDYLYDVLAGVRLKITAPSFYQVNHDCAELLYAKARELAAPCESDILLDLYCGAGSIGLSMARDVKELYGIEIIDSAVECARENAEANGINNAVFCTGNAADTERLLESLEEELGVKVAPDIIILDPPRAGCDERLVRFAASLNPKRIVYISCNPKTLARDVLRFIELGYNTDSVYPVDMFAMTGHVESVVCLTRRLDNELRERMN